MKKGISHTVFGLPCNHHVRNQDHAHKLSPQTHKCEPAGPIHENLQRSCQTKRKLPSICAHQPKQTCDPARTHDTALHPSQFCAVIKLATSFRHGGSFIVVNCPPGGSHEVENANRQVMNHYSSITCQSRPLNLSVLRTLNNARE